MIKVRQEDVFFSHPLIPEIILEITDSQHGGGAQNNKWSLARVYRDHNTLKVYYDFNHDSSDFTLSSEEAKLALLSREQLLNIVISRLNITISNPEIGMAEYKTLTNAAATVAGLLSAAPWEQVQGYWFRRQIGAGPGAGPDASWHVLRLGPAEPNGRRQLKISAKGAPEYELWIDEKNDGKALEEADRLGLKSLRESGYTQLTFEDCRAPQEAIKETIKETPAAVFKTTTKTSGAKTPMSTVVERPSTQTLVWQSMKDGFGQTIARHVEEVIFYRLKKRLIARVPQLLMIDSKALDEAIMFLTPIGIMEACKRYPDGFLGVDKKYIEYIMTACEFAIKGNSNKVAELLLDVVMPAMAELAGLGQKLVDAEGNPMVATKMLEDLKLDLEAIHKEKEKVLVHEEAQEVPATRILAR